ncbi:Sec-independent protein translocase protein TatB [Rhizobium sp. SL86]|jgi:sec-independent protein translocase protein TatB|uniref:Sec-independent protein translocase protein TatB n=1 Tax=Rhizobium sp. SL86 TaxID=2995148 RepID=UPI0022747AE7|nr:Sec-independent protein translocase protein TatB [Rhizobium sp. SL86]MCY1668515.1 Sec-independent protein translocase protein TatB [Rhizobium sp. SL86]
MLDIGWTELLVIAVVLIVVVGPKDLPPMLRAFGKMTANLRKMAGDFRTQFDQALREADMDDVRQTISDAQRFHPANAIREAINPLREMGNEIRSDLQKATTMTPLAEAKAEDGEASASPLEDLIPAPELSLPESAPASVAATPAPSPAQGSTTAPVAVTATGSSAAAGQPSVTASGPQQAAPSGSSSAPAAGTPAAEKKPRAPRKPKANAAAEPAVDVVQAEASTKSAPKRTRTPAKAADTTETSVVAAKPATRARKKPATPKDNA